MQEEQGIVNERYEKINELCTIKQEEKIEEIKPVIKMNFRTLKYEID